MKREAQQWNGSGKASLFNRFCSNLFKNYSYDFKCSLKAKTPAAFAIGYILALFIFYSIDKSISFVVKLFEGREQDQEQLYQLANFDSITQLPNRLAFEERLTQVIAQSKRHNRMSAVLFVDVDNFKNINDSFSHEAGDHVLQSIASTLREQLRDEDFLARLNGDTYAAILPEIADANHAGIAAQRLLNACNKTLHFNKHTIHCSISIGISTFPFSGDTMLELMKNAGISLRNAKQNGSNQYQYFSRSLQKTHVRRMQLENALHTALHNEQFHLQYQPQVDATNNTLFGVEALIRWQHPEMGFVPPNEFIPISESNRSIVKIGSWVITECLSQLARWKKTLGTDINFTASINLSPVQLQHADIVKEIEIALSQTQLSPQQLKIELTETAMMQNLDNVKKIMVALHDMGCRIAIDDFGTGYSSLSELRHLPIDIIKIDRSFVQGIHTNKEDNVIVNAVIKLAHELELDTVAEGVETQEQLEYLLERGCHIIQGYYFSKPLPANQVLEFFLKQCRPKS